MSNNHQRAIYALLTEKTIAYNAGVARVLGSVKAGILIGQLLYWQDKGADPYWVYKTSTQIEEETALTGNEQASSIKTCKKLGVLETKLARIPAVKHFHVNIEKLIELIASLPKNRKLVSSRTNNSVAQNTKTTTDSTSINTPKRLFVKGRLELAKKMSI